MSIELTKFTDEDDAAIERFVTTGDVKDMTPHRRVIHYYRRCDALGIDPLARPFDYLVLNGKTVLYANKTCTDLIRAKHNISLSLSTKIDGDMYIVTARATMPDGRSDESTGVITIGGLKGEALANAFMKAESKAKRRATISIKGLGMLDESEVDTIPTARKVKVTDDGEIVEPVTPEQTAAKLLEIHNRIDAADSVAELMDVYRDASESPAVGKETLSLVKKACGTKRKILEEDAA